MPPPVLVRARGLARIPLISSPSKMRGVARHKAHGLVMSQTGRVNYSWRPEIAPGRRISGYARVLRRATRSFAFSAYTAVGPGGVLLRLRGCSEHRPRTWLAFATPAGTASRPTLMTPHEVRPSVDETGIHL